MCGIFGIWHQDGYPVDLLAAQQAVNLLRHRGPDDEGYLLINTRNGQVIPCGGEDTDNRLSLPRIDQFFGLPFDLVLGHRRLSILDMSPAGHQPMTSRDGRFWIVYNGEIYNYLELRSELRDRGYEFNTETDTEVILAAYQEWGVDCLNRFNGMWAFGIWDNQQNQLFLACDRFGIKPLYYINEKDRFAFASEIKALVGKQGRPFEPAEGSIYHYLIDGLMPSPQRGETFFKGIFALPPGHWLIIQPNSVLLRRRYWILSTNSTENTLQSVTDVVEGFRELLIDSVRIHLRSDVPVGTCLSGGVDSSSIVCVVNRLMTDSGFTAEQIGHRQRTFSAVYDTLGPYNERVHIEKVLQVTGAEGNFTFPTAERLQADIEKLVWHQDEPFGSTSIFAQWCVMSKVRERGVKVLLDGQGPDEVLGGYRPFAIFLADLIRHKKIGHVLTEARAIRARTGYSLVPLLARAMAYQLPKSWVRVIRQQRRLSNAAILQSDFASAMRKEDGYSNEEYIDLNSHLQTQVQESSLPQLLRYEDRNSMAFSVEARVPYLDYRLVQFSFNNASQLRIYQGWTKWVLRQAMQGIVPDEIVWRRDKVGFETPERDWVRHWLSQQPDIFGDDALSRHYLNMRAIRRMLANPKAPVDSRKIWRWINLEFWLRVWSVV